MSIEISLISVILFINTGILTGLALYSYKRQTIDGGTYLFILLVAVAIWSLASFLEEAAGSHSMKTIWVKVSSAGTASAAPLLFLFILFYSGQVKKIKFAYLVLLWLIPVIVFIAALTNELNDSAWSPLHLDVNLTGLRSVYAAGPLAWTMALYSYTLLTAGTIIIILTTITTHRIFRRQLFTLIGATMAPWLGNLLFLAGLTPPGLDTTLASFTLSGIIITLGITRYRFLNVSPIASDALFRSMENGLLVLDNSMRMVSFNPSAKAMLKLSETDIGKKFRDIQAFGEQFAGQLTETSERQSELFITIDGKKRWLDVSVSVVRNRIGNSIGMLYSFWDITAQKNAEEALMHSEEVIRRLLATIPDIVIRTDLDGTITYVNEQINTVYPTISENDLTGRNMLSFIAEKDIERARENTGLMLQEPLGIQEYSFQVNDKQHIDCEVNGDVIRDSGNNPAGMVFVIRDITERKMAEQALHESEKKYHELSTLMRLMADNMPDMLWAKNLQKEYIFANKALCDNLLHASSTAEPLGKTDLFFAKRERESRPDDPEWHTFGEICRDSDAVTLEQMKPMQFDEFGNVRGEFLFLDVRKAPLINENGELIGVVGSARDVTDAKTSENQIRKLSQAVEQSPASVVITNPKGEIEYVNPKFTETTGYTFDEVKGKNPRILKSGKQSGEFYKNLWDTISSGNEWKGEFQNKKKNGELFWESAVISPIVNEKGEITNYLTIKEDITESKLQIENLKITRDTYQSIFNSVSEAIYVIDENGVFRDVNLGAGKMYGYAKEELTGMSPALVSAPDLNDLAAVERIHQQVSETGIPESFEFWGKRKNGEIFPKEVIVNKGTYFGKDCIIATAREITERKRAETARIIQYNIVRSIHTAKKIEELLEIVRQELGKLFDTSNFFAAIYHPETDTLRQIIFRDEKDHFEQWPAGLSISGQVVKTGKTIFLKGDDLIPFCKRHHFNFMGSKAACWLGVPILIRNKTIGVMVIQHYSDPNAFSEQDIALLEMVAHETGIYLEKQKLFIDLAKARDKAEESSQLKTAFLQNLSHEIRTPLNGIIGFSELIANPDLAPEDRNAYTGIIVERGWQLTSIINDILTIASLETKQEEVRVEHVDIDKLIHEQIAVFSKQAGEKGIKLAADNRLLKGDMHVYTDKTKVGQILNNLFTNALKFTSDGTITCGCRKKDNILEFFVSDTGISIEKSKHELIFDRFTQADECIRQDYGGTGLGLSICKGFAELIGGRIWVESEPGKGSTFFFTIPFVPVTEPRAATDHTRESALPDREITVLVAEDEPVNYLLLEVLLNKMNFRVLHAENGLQAVEMCKSKKVDIVLMDIKMPVLDGFAATKRIKGYRPDLPVIAQTAHAAQTHIDSFKTVFDDYITKPFTKEKLKLVISQHIKK